MLSNELMLGAGVPSVPSDFTVGNSVRFNSADSAYMNRTPSVAGNRQKFTHSMWVKRSALGSIQYLFEAERTNGSNTEGFLAYFSSDDKLYFGQTTDGGSTWDFRKISTQVFRDPSVWAHLVFAVDTTQATAAYRTRVYVDNTEITAWDTSVNATQNLNCYWNNNVKHTLGAYVGPGTYFNGYLADIYLIDGQQLTPTSFGKISTITSNWVPIAYSGTYGTTGFHLDFKSGGSAAALGTDVSGNSNTWTVNNISVTAGAGNDWLADAPSNNYCTMNPLNMCSMTVPNGALDTTVTGSASYAATAGTFGVTSGKWYWEVTVGATPGAPMIGIINSNFVITSPLHATSGAWVYYGANGTKYDQGSNSAYGASFTTGDVIGHALDMDGGTLTYYKNNTSQGTAFTGLTGLIFPVVGEASTSQMNLSLNFGQRDFVYTPPTGFKALNQTNLPEPITKQPYIYNNTALYAGTGAPQSIINLHLQPDLVWLKSRSNATDHTLYDSTRGAQAHLTSNDANAETTADSGLLSFAADGFSLGTLAQVNTSAQTYAAWTWKESVTAGFDIVSYVGDGISGKTVAHNLGVLPELAIIKNRSVGSSNWIVLHKDIAGNTHWSTGLLTLENYNNVLLLSSSNGQANYTHDYQINGSTNNHIAYLFASKEGYSKIGKYTGNGSTDGPFVYCGFKPKFVMMKCSSSTGSWTIRDANRPGYNPTDSGLNANLSDAEVAGANAIDLLANGFKLRTTGSDNNSSGATYIYAAFAESPFKYPRTQFSSSQTGLNLKGLRFNSADSAYLNRTPSVAGNRKTWTISMWVKRSALSIDYLPFWSVNSGSSDNPNLGYTSADSLFAQIYSSGSTIALIPTQVFRDPAQWFHLVWAVDTTLATANDRQRLYVNGQEITSFGIRNNPGLNYDTYVNSMLNHTLGMSPNLGAYFSGYIADYYQIDGQQLTPSAFAMTNATTGQWVPKIYTGTYGTNGCHLTFADSSSTAALGYDTSGNGNNWTVNNMSVTNDRTQDCLSDSPTENYCTFNPLSQPTSKVVFSDGNLRAAFAAYTYIGAATFAMTSGKWYWETYVESIGAVAHNQVGILPSPIGNFTTGYVGDYLANGYGYASYNGYKWYQYSTLPEQAYGATWTTGDTISVAFDADAGKIWWAKNGTWQASGDPASGSNAAFTGIVGTYTPGFGGYSTIYNANFGQRPFAFTPPTGFKALNSTNLPGVSILLPNAYMNTKLYTGTGASLALTDVGHQPDLVWIKSRSAATDHALYDSVRGVQARLESNTTDAEVTSDAGLTAFGTDGFTVNTLAQVNTNAATYAAWCWKKGATPGFDIITGTQTGNISFAHSLGVKPEFILARLRNTAVYNWVMTHKSIGTNMQDYYFQFNLSGGFNTSAGVWGGEPTTSLLYASSSILGTTGTVVAYVFAGVEGFSKFGKYTGNGSADGTFIWCGFRPKWVMILRVDSGSVGSHYRVIVDTARNPANVTTIQALGTSVNTAEGQWISGSGGGSFDILSNGFKMRGDFADDNANGGTYVFAAFAEAPFKYSRAR